MVNRSEVAIVSAFGSGHWLAHECRRLGLDVTLVDFSEALGRWTPEDWEGPFGVLNSESLTQSMLARLEEEDYSENVEEGFCVWLPSGPVDMRGPHSSYLLEKNGVSLDDQRYLTRAESLTEKERSAVRKRIVAEPFRSHWLVHLTHAVASPVFRVNSKAGLYGRCLPIMSPYSVRRVTRKGYDRNLDWLRSQGIKVLRDANLNDIAHDGSKIGHLEVDSAGGGALGADRFIWTLSSLESQRIAGRFVDLLFPRGVLQPEWVWVRYRVEAGQRRLQDVMPAKFVMIGDLELYWTHANFIMAEKTVTGENVDAWIRIPASHRFHKEYLQEMSRLILQQFSARVPGSNPRMVDMPQEFHYDEKTLGPARFCVYNADDYHRYSVRRFENMDFDGPELREQLDWNGRFRHQAQILRRIEAWKTKRDEDRAKEARRREQREASR